jgi:SAM-dependent methyltransferase
VLRHCPICGRRALRFARTYAGSRDRGICPRCGSRQRHRHLWLYLERRTDLLRRPQRLLHFAPEPGLRARLRAHPGLDYVSADLEPGAADRVLDITAIDLPDASVDAILCVHVLEHVGDDRAAMAEMLRVLRPGGWAIAQVPLWGQHTDEDPSVTDPAERHRRFGQPDHVRRYGRDFPHRLRAAGFDVDVELFRDEIPAAQRRRFGLTYDLFDLYGVDLDAAPEPWEVHRATRPRAPGPDPAER